MPSDLAPDPAPLGLRRAWSQWWTQPPRRHGEVLEHRVVGPLELLYDLVYVVLVGQAAHALSGHFSAGAVVQFAIVFALVQSAWLNGTLFHDLHSREDGRGRAVIFAQMALLSLLAVFTGDAFGQDGPAFALTYTVLVILIAAQWWRVRRLDEEKYQRMTGRYLLGQVAMIVLMAASVVTSPPVRLGLWVVVAVVSSLGSVLSIRSARSYQDSGLRVGESLVERFGLLVIVVLGEVVVGVVNGILESPDRSVITMVTAMLCLFIGFGFWWTYFDTTEHREPRPEIGASVIWLTLHLPVTGAIAAAGAGMVLVIEHADAGHVTPGARWLLGGSVALFLVSVAVLTRTLQDPPRATMLRGLAPALYAAAAVELGLAALDLSPWLLTLLMGLVPMLVWVYGFYLTATRVVRPQL